jgi:competence ComEA-like helix-hairpin-helix protein
LPSVPLAHSTAPAGSHLIGMTPMEGKGLLRGAGLLLILAVLRIGAAGIREGDSPAGPGENELPSLIQETRKARNEETSSPPPLESGERIDPNRAAPDELIRIPGMRTNLAQALVAHRQAQGPFSEARDLLEVSGIGPVTLARMEPFLDFSRPPPLQGRRPGGRLEQVDLNRAESEDLQKLPGIGPALAGRIVDYRTREGPFGAPEELLGIRGIGPATLKRIRPLLRVR